MTPTLSQAVAGAWIDRWDAQQQSYLPDREERFTALIDAVQECAGRPDPLVLDLGCGPGSLATRLLERIPAATVVAVDADPLLLALGRAAWTSQPDAAHVASRSGLAGPAGPAGLAGLAGPAGMARPAGLAGLAGPAGMARPAGPAGPLRFVNLDLRVPGWTSSLGLGRQADAAVSTTALHWLPPDALAVMYAEVATVLRPGGVVLNGDHLAEDAAAAPTLARLGRVLSEREQQRLSGAGEHRARFPGAAPAVRPGQQGETWESWWDAVTADPAFSDLVAERRRRSADSEHHGSPSGRLDVHVDALRAAGFGEVGTIWQHGDNRVLCAVLGSGER